MGSYRPILEDGPLHTFGGRQENRRRPRQDVCPRIWRLHGLLRDIVSDRDSRFTSNTWKDFLSVTGIRPHMSTAFHPQTDGQTERVNQVIEAYLRPFLNQEQDDWVDLLPMAEHACDRGLGVEATVRVRVYEQIFYSAL